ncbi:MAG TPA: thioredoxin family protein [Candidatus Sabulitectum sp.]|nr:thioredoxin family protein [Candidatus Sabulitectum sp.]
MALLSENDRNAIKGHFEKMTREVPVYLAKAPGKCDTEDILMELAELSPMLKVSVNESGDGMLPSLNIGSTGRVRFYGTPAGYEFSSLLTGIIDNGREEETLSKATMEFLDGLDRDLHIKVFVTPTCPHCPPSVVLAHRMAAYSPRVTAEAIEANEFQETAVKYGVQGVPRTVINETFSAEGSQPESYLIEALKRHMEKE